MQRVQASCVSDGLVGWVTTQGNQGTALVTEGDCFYKALVPSTITKGFRAPAADDAAAAAEQEVRKIRPGEMLEMLEPPRKDEASGMLRIRCRTKVDKVTGWATVKSADEKTFLVPA